MLEREVEVGFTASFKTQVTDKMIRQFAELSGDHNPIHLDDAYAANTRFKRRIAHGMIVGALISRALVDGIGRGGIYMGQSLKFVNPVFIDDTIEVTIKISSIRREKGIASVETTATNQNGELVVKGDAMIMMAAPGTYV
jgi:acyl dehydratase